MTVSLALEGQRMLRLGSAYSLTTGASSNERQAFFDEMARCSADGGPRVILVTGMDGNASIGVGKWGDRRIPDRRPGRPVGPRGLRHQNDAGRELLAHASGLRLRWLVTTLPCTWPSTRGACSAGSAYGAWGLGPQTLRSFDVPIHGWGSLGNSAPTWRNGGARSRSARSRTGARRCVLP